MYYLMTYHASMNTATSMSISSEQNAYTFKEFKTNTPNPPVTAGISTSILLETVLLRLGKDRLAWSSAVRTACGMSLVSMLAMEFTENLVTLGLVDRSMSLADPQFWAVTAVSMLAGFLAPLPYNYWRLKALGKACH
jgi:hypothetical protein